VVHLAGGVHVSGRDAAAATPYIVANVHVTRRLADAAARAGVRRIVLASTVKVYGEASAPGQPFRAGDAAAPQDAYARSKAEAENVLREIAAARGLEAVVLRLPLTYGPGVRGNFLTLLRSVAGERRLPLAGIVNRRSLLYVGNAVSAIEAALAAPALSRDAFPVADAETVSTPELVTRLARALSVEPRLFALPAPILRGAATVVGRRNDAARLLDSLEVDALRFRGLTAWTPPYSLDQGPRAGVDHRRVRHATARDEHAHAARGGRRQAVRAHAGNPATDRQEPARHRRSQGAGRTHAARRLRCCSGRWRHPLRVDHRRM